MKILNQVNTFLLFLFSICLIVSIAVYEKKLVALNETIEEATNHSNETLLNLDDDFNQKVDKLNSKINSVDEQLTNLEAFIKGDYINQTKDLNEFKEYKGSIGENDNLKYKLKTKLINNAMHFIFIVEYEKESDYLSSLQRFILEFLDKDGFTVIKQEVYVHELTLSISGDKATFSDKFGTDKEIYLLIDNAEISWVSRN